jgi:MoxR-like ATPase
MYDVRALNELVARESAVVDRITNEVGKVIVGQTYMIERILIGLLAGGHVLLEGVPGLAKTLTVRTLCDAIAAKFARIQFTPDLLPADVVGTVIYNQQKGEFTSKLGPVFANLVLADEINRAPAKVQSALLEAMQEGQVTIGDQTYPLPSPFIVMATQNPIEQEGTYPLPEAELDRFMFSVRVGYPSEEEEIQVVERTTVGEQAPVTPVLSAEKLIAFQRLVRKVPIAPELTRLAVRLARSTRPGPGAPDFVTRWLRWGAGPRASQYIVLGAKVRAALLGEEVVGKADILAVAPYVLNHRVVLGFQAEAEGISADQVVTRLLETAGRA